MLTVEVIEDDSAMRTLLTEWLADEGHRVHASAGFGSSTRGAETQGPVDLVIVDLPDLPTQGAATVRRVKSLHPGAALVGISTQLSLGVAGDSREARALGVQRLVSKPCSRRELLDAVAGASHTLGAAG